MYLLNVPLQEKRNNGLQLRKIRKALQGLADKKAPVFIKENTAIIQLNKDKTSEALRVSFKGKCNLDRILQSAADKLARNIAVAETYTGRVHRIQCKQDERNLKPIMYRDFIW